MMPCISTGFSAAITSSSSRTFGWVHNARASSTRAIETEQGLIPRGADAVAQKSGGQDVVEHRTFGKQRHILKRLGHAERRHLVRL
jgi:hypothetical protein